VPYDVINAGLHYTDNIEDLQEAINKAVELGKALLKEGAIEVDGYEEIFVREQGTDLYKVCVKIAVGMSIDHINKKVV